MFLPKLVCLASLISLSLTACGSSTQSATIGKAGADGMTISSGFNCSKISGASLFIFQGVTYSTGDVFSSCEVTGASLQSSSSKFYKSTQPGAASFYCSLTFDSEAPASGGYWTFSASGTTKKATYTDSGAVMNGTVVTFSSSDCGSF
jgi:hypothetical protein